MRGRTVTILSSLGLAATLLLAPRAMAQLESPSPCCAKICNEDGTSTRCGPLTPLDANEGTELLAGCIDVGPLACVGGQVLSQDDMQLTEGCACLLIAPDLCLNIDLPPGELGSTQTAEACTANAVAACKNGGIFITEPDPECPGGCDPACTGGQVCEDGTCVCPAGTTDCSGTCIDTSGDEANCGGCGNACAASETCENGVCTPPACDPACTGGQVCDDGTCVCPAGTTDCGGTCIDTSGDEANCGGCGNACAAGETCEGGVCTPPGCDPACTGGQVCDDGTCVCPAGTTDCGGTCIDTSGDEANCGGCGIACGAGETCENGVCVAPPPTCKVTGETCESKSECCAGLQCVDAGQDPNETHKRCSKGAKPRR